MELIERLRAFAASLKKQIQKDIDGVRSPYVHAMNEAADALEQATKEKVELEKLVYVPGLWKCVECKFVVINTNLHVYSGSTSANNDHQQCPNDCGPMGRVTERDSGKELMGNLETASKAHKEIQIDMILQNTTVKLLTDAKAELVQALEWAVAASGAMTSTEIKKELAPIITKHSAPGSE